MGWDVGCGEPCDDHDGAVEYEGETFPTKLFPKNDFSQMGAVGWLKGVCIVRYFPLLSLHVWMHT